MRVDRWLWAVRAVPTRTAATALCRAGHVTVNGRSAKPSSDVRAGDRITGRVGDRDRVWEVVLLLDKRVGAALAATCYVDLSPPPPPELPPGLVRDRSTGRPTKRDRRRIDRARGRG